MRLAPLLLWLVLAACSAGGAVVSSSPTVTPSQTGPETSSPAAATREPTGNGTELTGALGADSIEGGCVYLETADGTRYEVIYPDGWHVDRAGSSLVNPSGEVVAGPGDVVTVRGHEATDMASICQIGPIFQADEVVSIE